MLLKRFGLSEFIFVPFLIFWIIYSSLSGKGLKQPTPLHFLILVFFISVTFSMLGLDSTNYLLPLVELLVLLYLIIFCFAADQVIDNEHDLENVITAWMLGAATMSIVGMHDVFAVVFHGTRWFWTADPYRILATFRLTGQVAEYCLHTFFLAVAYSSCGGLSLRKRALLWSLAAVMVVLIIFSSRRSEFVSLAIGAAFFLIFRIRRPAQSIFYSLILLLSLSASVFFLNYNPEAKEHFKTRLRILLPSDDQSAWVKTETDGFIRSNFGSALDAFLDKPLVGIGYGAFMKSEYSEFDAEVHSMPLRILAECGLVGFIAYAAFMLALLYYAFQNILLARNTRWNNFSTLLFASLLALQVNYLYNQAVRARPFWLLVAIVIALHRILAQRKFSRKAGEEWSFTPPQLRLSMLPPSR
jgi:O-antigen ligase